MTTIGNYPLVIDRPRGYEKTFTTLSGPVTKAYPVDYGYLQGLINPDDNEDLDVFVGNGDLYGRFMKGRTLSGQWEPDERKWYYRLTPEQLTAVQRMFNDQYDGLLQDYAEFPDEQSFLADVQAAAGLKEEPMTAKTAQTDSTPDTNTSSGGRTLERTLGRTAIRLPLIAYPFIHSLAVAPASHRDEGFSRGAGYTLGTSLGLLGGALGGSALAGQQGLFPGGLAGASLGVLLARKLMGQPSWEQPAKQKKQASLNNRDSLGRSSTGESGLQIYMAPWSVNGHDCRQRGDTRSKQAGWSSWRGPRYYATMDPRPPAPFIEALEAEPAGATGLAGAFGMGVQDTIRSRDNFQRYVDSYNEFLNNIAAKHRWSAYPQGYPTPENWLTFRREQQPFNDPVITHNLAPGTPEPFHYAPNWPQAGGIGAAGSTGLALSETIRKNLHSEGPPGAYTPFLNNLPTPQPDTAPNPSPPSPPPSSWQFPRIGPELGTGLGAALGGLAGYLSGQDDDEEGQGGTRRRNAILGALAGGGLGLGGSYLANQYLAAPKQAHVKRAAGGIEAQLLGDWPAVADPNDPLQVEALPQLQRGLQRQFPGFRMTQRLWNRTLPLLREEQRMRNAGPQEGPGASHQFNLDRAGNELELMHGLGIPLRRSPYERVGPLPDAPRPPHLRWEMPPSGPPNFAPMGPPSGPPNFDP